jgi:hypothetical protein
LPDPAFFECAVAGILIEVLGGAGILNATKACGSDLARLSKHH